MSFSPTAPPTGLELAFGSGLDSERDEGVRNDTDGAPGTNVTSPNHQNCQVLEYSKVKGQPLSEHSVPPQPSAPAITSEEERSAGRSITAAPCSHAGVQENVTAKNISSDAAMETGDDITPDNKGMPSGAMQPSTDEMDDKISHQPDVASSKGKKIKEEAIKRNESFMLPEPKSCDPRTEVCPNRTGGEPGNHQFIILH